MNQNEEPDFGALVAEKLGIRLPEDLAGTVSLSDLPAETVGFIHRALDLMAEAGYSATDFTPTLVRWFSITIPTMLPGAWGGRIPPITLPGRHARLDAYVAGQQWPDRDEPCRFLDIGCGFPPLTTADTARALPHWQVTGVDRCFAEYVLYDPEGHYACFDAQGDYLYLQPAMKPSARALYENPAATRQRFSALFHELRPSLSQEPPHASETAEKDGHRLVRGQIRDFHGPNLAFVESDLKALSPAGATVVRCMNLLVYFSADTRSVMLRHAGDLLEDDGILMAGTNGFARESRYAIYRKASSGLEPVEFAFSPDNLTPIVFMPWFSIHADDPESRLLARLLRSLRSDAGFWPAFSRRMDALMAKFNLCQRLSDGFLKPLNEEMTVTEFIQNTSRLWQQMEKEGFMEEAVSALERSGYTAWRNPAGDIAVIPPEGALPS